MFYIVNNIKKFFKNIKMQKFYWFAKNIIDSKKVINSTSEKIEYAYPILSIRNKNNIKKVFRYLEQFKNLHLLGRSAQFKYLHTHDLFKDANNQIEKIIH